MAYSCVCSQCCWTPRDFVRCDHYLVVIHLLRYTYTQPTPLSERDKSARGKVCAEYCSRYSTDRRVHRVLFDLTRRIQVDPTTHTYGRPSTHLVTHDYTATDLTTGMCPQTYVALVWCRALLFVWLGQLYFNLSVCSSFCISFFLWHTLQFLWVLMVQFVYTCCSG